jgi:N4-gp56 family major capsid protein
MADYTNTMDWLNTASSGTTSGSDTLPYVGLGIYNRVLLERAQPSLYHAYFGQQKSQTRRNGLSMAFRRYEKLSTTQVPLSDGVTPPGVQLTKTDYVATLTQHGNWTIVTDNVDFYYPDAVMTEAAELMGENMGESMDLIVRDVLVAGTNLTRIKVDNSGTYDGAGVERTDVLGALCKSALDGAMTSLKREDAKAFTPQIPASVKVNTFPVGEAFWCLIHPDAETDLFGARGGFWGTSGNLVGFVPVEQYASSTGVMKGEVGKYRNVRFVTSTHAKIWPDSGGAIGTTGLRSTTGVLIDVYAALLFARDAYGVIKPDSSMAKVITHRAGGPGDPLNQRNTVGWVGWIAAKILMQEWMHRIEHGASA